MNSNVVTVKNAERISESEDGVVTLSQILSHMKSFSLREPFLFLVGSLSRKGETSGDIDILVRGGSSEIEESLKVPLESQITQLFPEDLRRRIHVLWNEDDGPYSSYIPIGRLKLEVPDDISVSDIVQMSLQDGEPINTWVYQCENPREFDEFEVSSEHKLTVGDKVLFCKGREVFSSSSVADIKPSGDNLIVSRAEIIDIPPFLLDDSVDGIRQFSLMSIERIAEEVKSDASLSRQNDSIVPGRFFLSLESPATSISASNSGKHFDVTNATSYTEERYGEQFDLFVERKYEGVHVTFHYDGKNSTFFSDDGRNVTRPLESIGETLVKVLCGKSVVVSIVLESWIDDEHQSLEVTTRLLSESNVGAVLTKEEIEGKSKKKKRKKPKIVANCLTVLYYDGYDLHRSAAAGRRKLIESFKWPQSTIDIPDSEVNLAPSYHCRSKDELHRALSNCVNSTGSGGAMVVNSDMAYPLDGFSSGFFSVKNYLEAQAIVWRRNKTEVDGTFNYDFAFSFTERPNEKGIVRISGNDYVQVGRSYNTEVEIPVGGIVTIRYRQVNWYEDQSRMLLYESTFIRYLPAARVPDSMDDVKERAAALGFLEIKSKRRNLDLVVNLNEETRTRLQLSDEFQTPIPMARMPREGLGSESCILFRDDEGGLHYSRYGGVVEGRPELLVTQPIKIIGDYPGVFDCFRYLPEGAVQEIIDSRSNSGFARNAIFGILPVHGGTIFDPACGDGGFLYEAAKRGYSVIGNDESPLAYHLARSRFLSGNDRIPADEFQAIMDGVTPKEGLWTSREIWKDGKTEILLETKRFIDGLIDSSQDSGFVMGVVARFISTIVGDDGMIQEAFGQLSLDQTKSMLSRAALAINQQNVVTGRVTRKDTFSMVLPDADCVFFDSVRNVSCGMGQFDDASSLLNQRSWTHEDTPLESFGRFSEKLERKYEHLVFIEPSSSFDLSARFSTLGRSPIRRSVSCRSETIVYCSLTEDEIARQSDNYMAIPDEDGTYNYGVQAHFQGHMVHWDFGATGVVRDKLIGWILNAKKIAAIEDPVLTVSDGRRLLGEDEWKIDSITGRWAKRPQGSKMVNAAIGAETKPSKPDSWLRFQGVIERGGPGATKNFPGVYINLDYGEIEYGAQKPLSHEYFMRGTVFSGRYLFRLLRVQDREKEIKRIVREIGGGEVVPVSAEELVSREDLGVKENGAETGWVMIKPNDQTPYVLSSRALRLGWMPPEGVSALPKIIRSEIPKDLTYWQKGITLLKRDQRREEVSKWYSKGHPGISRTAEEPFERFVLTRQWFKGGQQTDEDLQREIWTLYLLGKQVRVFELSNSLIDDSITEATETQDKNAEDVELKGFISPGTKLNRDSDIPSFIDRTDQGSVTIYLNKPKVIKLRLSGNRIKSFIYMSETDGCWQVEKTRGGPS